MSVGSVNASDGSELHGEHVLLAQALDYLKSKGFVNEAQPQWTNGACQYKYDRPPYGAFYVSLTPVIGGKEAQEIEGSIIARIEYESYSSGATFDEVKFITITEPYQLSFLVENTRMWRSIHLT